jgi:hypothetical protein
VDGAGREQTGHDQRQRQRELRDHEPAPDAARIRSFSRSSAAFAECVRPERPQRADRGRERCEQRHQHRQAGDECDHAPIGRRIEDHVSPKLDMNGKG